MNKQINYMAYPGTIKTPLTVIEDVAKKYGVTVEQMKGKSRMARIVEARQYAMYLLNRQTEKGSKKYSLTFIGNLFGKDHATVIHADKAISNRIKTNQLLV